jgi:hypothetical protein
MKGIMIMAALVAAFAGTAPALAFADGIYIVRNASQTRLMCALHLERGSAFVRFSLAPGRTFGDRRETFGRDRVLVCSSSLYRRATFRIRAGSVYELTESSSGQILLRTVDSR